MVAGVHHGVDLADTERKEAELQDTATPIEARPRLAEDVVNEYGRVALCLIRAKALDEAARYLLRAEGITGVARAAQFFNNRDGLRRQLRARTYACFAQLEKQRKNYSDSLLYLKEVECLERDSPQASTFINIAWLLYQADRLAEALSYAKKGVETYELLPADQADPQMALAAHFTLAQVLDRCCSKGVHNVGEAEVEAAWNYTDVLCSQLPQEMKFVQDVQKAAKERKEAERGATAHRVPLPNLVPQEAPPAPPTVFARKNIVRAGARPVSQGLPTSTTPLYPTPPRSAPTHKAGSSRSPESRDAVLRSAWQGGGSVLPSIHSASPPHNGASKLSPPSRPDPIEELQRDLFDISPSPPSTLDHPLRGNPARPGHGIPAPYAARHLPQDNKPEYTHRHEVAAVRIQAMLRRGLARRTFQQRRGEVAESRRMRIESEAVLVPGNEKTVAWLENTEDPCSTPVLLQQQETVLGGKPGKGVVYLRSPSVRDRHCVVRRARHGRLTVKLCERDALVFVNSHRVAAHEELPLSGGDRLVVGSQHAFLVHCPRPQQQSAMSPRQANHVHKTSTQPRKLLSSATEGEDDNWTRLNAGNIKDYLAFLRSEIDKCSDTGKGDAR